ncbi:MAG: allophanate hydrolase, partial [Bacteroidetes bacterium]
MLKIEVHKPGLLTTIQDLGRSGYQHLGVPISGALDRAAAQRANWLV